MGGVKRRSGGEVRRGVKERNVRSEREGMGGVKGRSGGGMRGVMGRSEEE